MFIKRSESGGFTILEMMIGLGLSAIALLGLLATSDYFNKSKLAIETRIAFTNTRNQIAKALAQRYFQCVGGDCTKLSGCVKNLRSKSANSLVLPSSIISSLGSIPAKIEESDRVELAIGTVSGDGTSSTLVAVSGNDPTLPTSFERTDRLLYEILLVGDPQSTVDPRSVTYSGSVVIRGHRDLIGRADVLTTKVPFEFTLDRATGALRECDVRGDRETISGGAHDVDDCAAAGGIAVPSVLGPLCRFRSNLVLSNLPTAVCPPGFTGDANTGCALDTTSSDSDVYATIPPCPKIKTKDGTVEVEGVSDAVLDKGYLYCNYQGPVPASVGTTEVGDCPVDPDSDPAILPRPGWTERPTPTFDIATNLRRCEYTFKCDSPNEVVYLGSPLGDGKTPTCKMKVVGCPNRDINGYTLTPPPWVMVSASPLVCKANSTYAAGGGIPTASCKGGFTPVPANILIAHPEIAAYNDSRPKVSHVICF